MFKKEKTHIFITCTPKSGSTYLLQLLSNMLSFDIRIFIAAFDRTGQDMYEPKIIGAKNHNTVTHQHTRCSVNNLAVLEKHDIKPMLLTRNIYDSVISMHNHMHLEPENSWWPMGYIDHNYYELSTTEQYDFIIDLIMPWYVNFYVSWKRHPKPETLLWITYEQLMEDKLTTLQKILDFYGIKYRITEKKLLKYEEIIKGKTRRSKHPVTNKRIELTEAQRKRASGLTHYYKDIDFSQMGLKNNKM